MVIASSGVTELPVEHNSVTWRCFVRLPAENSNKPYTDEAIELVLRTVGTADNDRLLASVLGRSIPAIQNLRAHALNNRVPKAFVVNDKENIHIARVIEIRKRLGLPGRQQGQ
jgi:hypothetical protein